MTLIAVSSFNWLTLIFKLSTVSLTSSRSSLKIRFPLAKVVIRVMTKKSSILEGGEDGMKSWTQNIMMTSNQKNKQANSCKKPCMNSVLNLQGQVELLPEGWVVDGEAGQLLEPQAAGTDLVPKDGGDQDDQKIEMVGIIMSMTTC